MMIKQSTMEWWVGFFVVAAIAALFFLSLNHTGAGSSPSTTYTLYAEFDDIGSLKAGSVVKSAGVMVGRTDQITLNQKSGRARVTLIMDDRYHFSRDVRAAILTAGIMGEQYIGLEEGADEEVLADQDEIEATNSAFVLEKMIGRIMMMVMQKSS